MLLDLFCGAGGASYGYHLAGFPANSIVGIDNQWFRHYPFKFVQGGVFELLPQLLDPDSALHHKYLASPITHIHASPPCQFYSSASAGHKKYTPYADYIAPLRDMLFELCPDIPYVIENVEGAPLIPERTILLCGTMFPSTAAVPMTKNGGLRVIRHRLFESNVPLTAPPSPRSPQNPDGTKPHKANYPKYHQFNGHPYVRTTRKGYAHFGKLDVWNDFVMVAGGGNAPAAACRDAMGIDWMNRDELCDAIPPAYTRHIGWQLLTLSNQPVTPPTEVQMSLF